MNLKHLGERKKHTQQKDLNLSNYFI